MITISLCMIVKNEQDTLERCLNSVKDIVDEIIIIDTGSTDKTKEIAKKFTNNIYDFEWCYDFSKARNFSFSKATKEYIMWLDADDVILEKDRKKLIHLKKNLDKDVDVVMLKYDLNLDENGVPLMTFYRERILKRENNYFWESPIHEVIQTYGNIVKEDISITHKKIHQSDPKRNLLIFENMIKNNVEFDARQTFYYARELYYSKEYEKSIAQFKKFLSMPDAWKENKISAQIDLYNLYMEIKKEDLAIDSVLNTFKYDLPRAEACCLLASYFANKEDYKNAVYWYKEATKRKINIDNGGFYIIDYYRYIPYINLSFCYYKLNNLKLSYKYNEKAGKIKPNSLQYLSNKKFFESLNYDF